MEIADPRVDPSLVPEGSRAVVIAEHQTEYRDLPSIRTPDGQVITRWTLTDEERLRVLGERTSTSRCCRTAQSTHSSPRSGR
jgi:hypothetical protein